MTAMAGRSVRIRAAAACATVAAAVLAVGSDSAAARSSNAVPLHVLLTVSSNLTAMAREALVGEAERIWRRERVRIEWARAGRGIERPDARLRVLVVSRPPLAANANHEWAVAELVPEATPRAV